MADELPKLALLERRLTALEREVHELKQGQSSPRNTDDSVPDKVLIPCDAPGLLASHAYEVEKFVDGRNGCWVGSEGAIQLKLPVAPTRRFLCKLSVTPFHRVNFDELKLNVNGVFVDHSIETSSHNLHQISFYGQASHARNINIIFVGVKSFRPVDIGESQDIRFLAFQFFGAEIDFILAPND